MTATTAFLSENATRTWRIGMRLMSATSSSLRFSERIALEMISAVLWPLNTYDRIGVLLTILTDNVTDVIDNEEEVEVLLDRLRLHFMLESLDHRRRH
jgi:hypothetical protein